MQMLGKHRGKFAEVRSLLCGLGVDSCAIVGFEYDIRISYVSSVLLSEII